MKNLKTQIKELQNNQKGFTLIELLIVIVIIAALAVTVFTALNPIKRIKDAHDSRRATDVETILDAIHSYIVDNNGNPPAAIPTTAGQYMIGTCATCNTLAGLGATNYTNPASGATWTSSCSGASAATNVNSGTLATQLASYTKSLPTDPLYNGNGSTWTTTGYSITVSAGNIFTVTACFPEDAATTISQSR